MATQAREMGIKAQFKVSSDMVGASAHDVFVIICEDLERANSLDGTAIQKAIAGAQNDNGRTGTIRDFSKGVVNEPALITRRRKPDRTRASTARREPFRGRSARL